MTRIGRSLGFRGSARFVIFFAVAIGVILWATLYSACFSTLASSLPGCTRRWWSRGGQAQGASRRAGAWLIS